MSEPHPESETASLFIKLVVSKGLVEDAVAKEVYQESQRRQADPSVILVERGILTPHLVSSLQAEVQRALGPKTIGGFRIHEKLGQGGMGVVYKAVQVSVNREVALKVLSDQVAGNPDFADRFLREAHAAARVNHPNVITIYDAGADGTLLYMAMEYVSGGDADRLMRAQGGRLGQRRAAEIIRDAARGLAAVQRAGLIHRDIKPANIFLSEDGTAKLADLGLSRRETGDDRMTMTGAIMGTPAYMAPEQADGSPDLDIRLDIYSLGATLYALLVGRPPYTGNSPFAVVAKALNEPFPDPRQEVTGLDDTLAEVVMRCTCKAREERYQQPKELVDALEAIVSRLPEEAVIGGGTFMPPVRPPSTASNAARRQTTRATLPVQPPAAKGGRAPLLVAAAVAMVAVAAGGIWWGLASRAEAERQEQERVAAERVRIQAEEQRKAAQSTAQGEQEREAARAAAEAEAERARRMREEESAAQAEAARKRAAAESERMAAEQRAEAARKEAAAEAERSRKEAEAAELQRTQALVAQVNAMPDSIADQDLDRMAASVRGFTGSCQSAVNRTAVENAWSGAQARVLSARTARRQAEEGQRRVLEAITGCSDEADAARLAAVGSAVTVWLAGKPAAELAAPVEAAWKAKQAACAASRERLADERKRAALVPAAAVAPAQQDWGAYERNMAQSFTRAKALEGAAALEAWQRFLSTYRTDDPTSDEDDRLRELAGIQLEEVALGVPAPAKLYADAQGNAPERPVWAKAFDKDDYGWYADLVLEKNSYRFRWCPAGSFSMGSREGESNHGMDERVHQVTLTSSFWLGETEVTQALWKEVGGMFSSNPSRFVDLRKPVEQVSFKQCQDFLKSLNKEVQGLDARLPTEAQWEYACRAGSKAIYAGALSELGWCGISSGMTTHAPKERAANAWGLFDMHGNVAEWCIEAYADYPVQAVSDPAVMEGEYRVCRGGSWSDGAGICRSAARGKVSALMKSEQVGFRILVLDRTVRP